jgi:hypothetical protein
MSYPDYLKTTKQTDSRRMWKEWKIDVCGMSEKQAIKMSYSDYEPLTK